MQGKKRKAEEVDDDAPASKSGVPLKTEPKTCVHEVALPPGGTWTGNLEELRVPTFNGTPAKQYPFVLDPFQSTAIACLVRRYDPAFPRCCRRAACRVVSILTHLDVLKAAPLERLGRAKCNTRHRLQCSSYRPVLHVRTCAPG